MMLVTHLPALGAAEPGDAPEISHTISAGSASERFASRTCDAPETSDTPVPAGSGLAQATLAVRPLIRAWAESKGLGVSSRGRIKKEIIDQYDQVHG